MGWRILQITKPCKLSVQQKQLLYQSDDTNITMPIEDLSVVILETGFVQLTGSLLAEFAMNDVVLLVCDASHLPSGTFFSFHSKNLCFHTLILSILRNARDNVNQRGL